MSASDRWPNTRDVLPVVQHVRARRAESLARPEGKILSISTDDSSAWRRIVLNDWEVSNGR